MDATKPLRHIVAHADLAKAFSDLRPIGRGFPRQRFGVGARQRIVVKVHDARASPKQTRLQVLMKMHKLVFLPPQKQGQRDLHAGDPAERERHRPSGRREAEELHAFPFAAPEFVAFRSYGDVEAALSLDPGDFERTVRSVPPVASAIGRLGSRPIPRK